MHDKKENYQDWLIHVISEVVIDCIQNEKQVLPYEILANELNSRGYTNNKNQSFSGKTIQKFISRLSNDDASIEHRSMLQPDMITISEDMPVDSFTKHIARMMDLHKQQRSLQTSSDYLCDDDEIDDELARDIQAFIAKENKKKTL
jgi:hypothetical protein